MVKLEIKNIKELQSEALKEQFTQICNEKRDYLDEYFKKYEKDLTLEVIVNKDGDIYKVSASLNMKSKKVLHVEESKDVLAAVTKMLKQLITEVKKQKELERKDYLYKRKR